MKIYNEEEFFLFKNLLFIYLHWLSVFSPFSSPSPYPHLPSVSIHNSFLFHFCLGNGRPPMAIKMEYQITVRLNISPFIKAGQGDPV